jgi:hypothetical protein
MAGTLGDEGGQQCRLQLAGRGDALRSEEGEKAGQNVPLRHESRGVMMQVVPTERFVVFQFLS